MRIFSSFRDYYDTLSFQDVHGVHYIRKEEDCKLYKSQIRFDADIFNQQLIFKKTSDFWIATEIIAFCGKLFFLFRPDLANLYISNPSDYKLVWYTPELIIPELIPHINSKSIKTLLIKNEDKLIQKLKKYTNRAADIIDNNTINNLALEFNAPYFKIKPRYYSFIYEIYPNFDSLQKIKFYKVMDINQTYQEIDMYLNSVLIVNKEYPQITDNKVLIEAKGFDLKTSFRHPIK